MTLSPSASQSQSLNHPHPKSLSLRARGLKKLLKGILARFRIISKILWKRQTFSLQFETDSIGKVGSIFRTELFTLSPYPSSIKGKELKKATGDTISGFGIVSRDLWKRQTFSLQFRGSGDKQTRDKMFVKRLDFWRVRQVLFLYLVMILAALFVVPVEAQEVTQEAPPPVLNDAIRAEFQVDNSSPLLGEPFNVTVVVEASSDIEILTWVEFDEPIEVLEAGEVESEVLVSEMRHTRNYEVVLWDVGEYLSPEILLTYRQAGATNSVAVSSFFVQVPAQIINAEDAVARPLKSPIDLPYTSPTIYIGIGIGIVILLLILARLIQVSRKNVVQIVRASPAEKTIAVLEDLKVQNLSPAMMYELVANHLREYIQSQFAIEAVEMTTVELMSALREHDLFPKEHRNRLQKVLEQADLVKFARFQPDESHSNRLVNFAIKWLKETERLQKNG